MKTITGSVRDASEQAAREALAGAAEYIRKGGLVVFPTETVYGLGGNAMDPHAAGKIYAAKGRPADNPLIVHVASPEEADFFAETNEVYFRIARAFMPGPITVILSAKENLPRTVTAGLDTVAVRCPSHPAARELIRMAQTPIAAPSANLSGSPSPTCFEHSYKDMNGRVDMILDGGACEIGLESTIVKPEADGSLTLLRPGAVTQDDLMAVCPRVNIAAAVLGALKEGERALSPGMKYRHYAPKAPVTLLDGNKQKRIDYISRQNGKIAYLCYEEDLVACKELIPGCALYSIGGEADESTQAQRLFALLRDADAVGYDRIFAPLPKKNGMGMALYNRMIRAASHDIQSL